MGKESCWDARNCGKGPDSENPCKAATFEIADGYLGGDNGSRACYYIAGTVCFDDDKVMSIPEKIQTYCFECPFFQKIQYEEGPQSNIFYYLRHLQDKLISEDRYAELPMIQQDLFTSKKKK